MIRNGKHIKGIKINNKELEIYNFSFLKIFIIKLVNSFSKLLYLQETILY